MNTYILFVGIFYVVCKDKLTVIKAKKINLFHVAEKSREYWL